MQVSYTRLIDFIAGEKVFLIPVYQRNYDWRKIHCEQFFKDITQIMGTDDTTSHFLGTIVCQKPNNDTYIIIDGQQRLTSFLLLAKAICDVTGKEKYLFDLKPSEYDSAIFKKIMVGDTFTEQEKNSRLYQSYDFFKNKLVHKIRPKAELLLAALKKLKIVAMELGNENPQQIFESLNSTGKDLTETELIRNFLLMDLERETQENFYKNYWLKMELLLKTSETFDKFMLYYLIMKRKSSKDMHEGKNIHNSQNAMYETFKKYFKENYSGDKTVQIENLLADMYRNAQFYSRLLFDENTNFSELSALDKKFYELIYLLKSTNMQIILMGLNERYARGDFNENTFIETVNALISFKCRSKICRQTGIDTDQTAGNVLSRLEKSGEITTDTFWKAITDGKGKYTFPSNEDFRQALLSNELNLTIKDTCKYLLYVLDGATDFPNYSDASVELVIPKKFTAEWKKYLRDKNDSQAEQYVNSLGNLVLVDNAKKNAAFSDKKVEYTNSRFDLTREVSKNSDWTSRQIRRRAENLADKAIKIWELPKKYIPAVNVNENIFTLDSDFNRFTGTKPAIVSIFNVEKNLKNWSDFLRELVTQLYNLDKDIFKRAVNDSGKNNLFSDKPETLVLPFKIDENYYVGYGLDTKSCLKVIKALVMNFDNLSGTNFKDEIWFTLKD